MSSKRKIARKYFCQFCGEEMEIFQFGSKKRCCDRPECKSTRKAAYNQRQKESNVLRSALYKGVKNTLSATRERKKRFCIYVPQGEESPCGKLLKRNFFFCEEHHAEVNDCGMETL